MMESGSTQARTELTRWRLKDDEGRHTWHYLETASELQSWPQRHADRYFLGLPMGLPTSPKAVTPLNAVEKGLSFVENIQLTSGHWGGDSGGPMMFGPGIVIAWYVTETPIPAAIATEMQAYLVSRVSPEDGGWGLHSTAESNLCGTSLNYIALRLLGMDAQHPTLVNARSFLHRNGSCLYSSIWSKVWMAVLGIVDWDIVHPMPPELWLLPDWMPIAPWRLYIEIRMALQSMSYLYSKRWQCIETKLLRQLRGELLPQPFETIPWSSYRTCVSSRDYKQTRSWVINGVNWAYLNIYQPYLRTNFLKSRAEEWVSRLIDMQDANTDYGGIAATDAPLNTIICYIRDGPNSPSFKSHVKRLREYLWMSRDGMIVNSTNGSQAWDTAFMVQAVCDSGLHTQPRWRSILINAMKFLDEHQIKAECDHQQLCYRQQRLGCWAFSNRHQGIAVSDCTAEALKAVIVLHHTPDFPSLFTDQRIFDAVDSILLYQNSTGGVSSFEARRGGTFLERLNLTEIFAGIMVEHDYTECTSSCVTALVLFRKHWPVYRSAEVNTFIKRAVDWIKSDQRLDGSWYGWWAICFTNATMFGLDALGSVGETYDNSDSSRRGCDFLLSKQRPDGGWSEDFVSCEKQEYIEDDTTGSLTVQTAWALLGLMAARYPDKEPIQRGIDFLMSRQRENGEWLEQAIPGTFHSYCTFSYPNYKFTFTMKALGTFANEYTREMV